MSDTVLSLQQISKTFTGNMILKHIDLEVERGEMLAIVGESGTGKSALLKIVGGVFSPSGGSITLEGKAYKRMTIRRAMRHGIAFLQQDLNYIATMSVADNIHLGRELAFRTGIRWVDEKQIINKSKDYLKLVGLDISPLTPITKLSVAEQQLVKLAQALALKPKILVLDDPTACLSKDDSEQVLRLIDALRQKGTTVIMTSSRLEEVTHCATRVIALRDGTISGELRDNNISIDSIHSIMKSDELLAIKKIPAESEAEDIAHHFREYKTRAYPAATVSFSINGGEILGITGAIGSGRSELMRAICGIDKAREGLAVKNQTPLHIQKPQDAINHGIYLISEDRAGTSVIPDMSVRENLTLASLNSFTKNGIVNRSLENTAVAALCAEWNITTPSSESPVSYLSPASQQKVACAKWMSMDPKVVIFDEPTRDVRVKAKRDIYEIILKLASQNVAVIVVSSMMEEVMRICDRIAVMNKGSINGILERSDFSEHNILELMAEDVPQVDLR